MGSASCNDIRVSRKNGRSSSQLACPRCHNSGHMRNHSCAVELGVFQYVKCRGYSARGGALTAHSGSAPNGWSIKKTHVPSASFRCTSMP
jgi:hypothetical protein